MLPICEEFLQPMPEAMNADVYSFITGYWIWSKILENLATLGYDPWVKHRLHWQLTLT